MMRAFAAFALVSLAAAAPLYGSPLAAQGDTVSEAEEARRQAMVDEWPPQRQNAYSRLPAAMQRYFWQLPVMHHDGFWLLSHEQIAEVMRLTPEQQESVWQQIELELAMLEPGSGDELAVITFNIPGNYAPVPSEALNRVYPRCSGEVQDGCRNPEVTEP